MRKPIWIAGKPHRIRRGKLVEIPAEWLGKVTSRTKINQRPSKQTRKARRRDKRLYDPTGRYLHDESRSPIES